ncbi:MAG: UDP-N-acetylmuramate:L-alanyl-gamma-D-glutamyl-meso-diaminopimelate ligase [Gammaproteobacteria bacterium]|nr:UDP-N-acetylmuramate:L-alanyl-gamma-D-glutamyl-meso-diaminopimelate ligase [Gammaproteobacteria bacterium]MYF01481.1 UDP-N-acetylmuramate:L-alanyl-gamma-D-glutamyl-meso-diaminopimelate ligase [Gammaproteobacteria bacterium]MYI77945.1 UDP-N-acetylmuramate:L-alanyl-gamma-D-glutamyl-meso-diaminopimelate ligase [Gammaproteobacteria bacterium]
MGIGGTLMGSLALLAKEAGFNVKGFDGKIYPPMSDLLSRAKIDHYDSFDPSQLQPPPELVVVGNANLPRGCEPLEYVLNQKLPYTSGAEWLGTEILKDRQVIAVAGTHGKTTATAMIAWILAEAGVDPGFLIGGVSVNSDVSAKLGSGRHFVVEADEYDTSYFDRRSKFLHYRPDILILTSLEFDHADIFENLDAIKYQFQHLIRAVPGNGQIIVPCNYDHIEAVLQRGCWTPITRFSTTKNAQEKFEFCADNVLSDGSAFDVVEHRQGKVGRVSWNLLGAHNVANGLAALIASYHAGIELDTAIQHLSAFPGVKRRMEVIAQNDSTTVYSDFAHHPTAIASTLEGIRKHVGSEKVIAVIEPRTHTMSLGTLRSELKECCVAADEVIWFQSPTIKWKLEELLTDTSLPTKIVTDIDALVMELCEPNRQKTHVVVMSNGAFGGIYQKLTDAFH